LNTVAIDLLHSWHLGGISEYVGAVLWFLIDSKVFVKAYCNVLVATRTVLAPNPPTAPSPNHVPIPIQSVSSPSPTRVGVGWVGWWEERARVEGGRC
jgi:hypothetical protein